jgi:hypothetical protein
LEWLKHSKRTGSTKTIKKLTTQQDRREKKRSWIMLDDAESDLRNMGTKLVEQELWT